MNYLKTAMLLAGMTGLFLAIGFVIGGEAGMVFAFLLALGMNAFAYWNSDKLVLRMYGARQVDERSSPEFHRMVKELSDKAGLPMPKVYIMDDPQPNAFATGRNPQNAAVAATTGLLQMLSRDEIAGVMAHELAHVKNRDTLIMTITATIAGAISMIANFGLLFGGMRGRDNPFGIVGLLLLVILAPLAAMLVQMAISRTREYAADRLGAEISGDPMSLASALEKISGAAKRIENRHAEQNPATAHMFIINPLSGARMDNLFSTHPNTENRIAALRQLAGGAGDGGGFRRFDSSRSDASGPGPWSVAGARGGRRAGPWR